VRNSLALTSRFPIGEPSATAMITVPCFVDLVGNDRGRIFVIRLLIWCRGMNKKWRLISIGRLHTSAGLAIMDNPVAPRS